MGDLLSANLAAGQRVIKAARQLIFPEQCPLCHMLLDGGAGLCGSCWRDTPFILGLACDQCGQPMLGPDTSAPVHCDACRALEPPWTCGRAVLSYNGNGRRLVLAFKHGDRLDLGPLFARWMALRAAPLIRDDTVVVPVPMHWRRRIQRRYNQAAVLSRLLARGLQRPHIPDALIRVRHTAPQSAGAFDDRLDHVRSSIQLNPKRATELSAKSILLIDDVITTGATFTTCSLQLQKAHVNDISVIALSRAAQSY